ncbi:TetR family transcriptional regulator [Bacillus sp. ISL-35]|uniref:TetR/AcrR family transcriptional regulator n=1 Tax=Bacillus sp. ISL-35 TaxID=2819122 RepID=UPI001BE84CDF|nr:TetR family transcriptional regulator [Bacillus sp. ISL-35]MBT2678548.1 TetR family transcriptional regulator [Bacillus sp. ISL-35]MBT2705853.1 TetR family transcriptional regulator [Chryseobacterium sp. ISL-80]
MSPKVSQEHLKQRRADILQAAKEVFIEHGYERATMKHIMDAANVSRGGLYQYFSSKEDVFETFLEEALDIELEDTLEMVKQNATSYWNMLMKTMFGDDGKPDDEMDPLAPAKLEYFIIGRNDVHRREYGATRYGNGLKIFANIIEHGQKSGEFSSRFDHEIIARSIITFIDGLAVDNAMLSKADLKIKEQSIVFVEYLRMALEVSGNSTQEL